MNLFEVPVARVPNYSQTFVEEYHLQFQRGKLAGIVQDLLLSEFLNGMSSSTNKWYMHNGKVLLRQPHGLDILKEFNKGFQSNQCLVVTALDEVMFTECDGKTALFLFRATNASIRHKDAVFYVWLFFQFALLVLIRIQ